MWTKIDLSLINYWLILRKRKRIFLFTFSVVFSSVILYTQIQTPIYRAICSIKLVEPKSVIGITTSSISPAHYNFMSSTSRALASRPIIEKVIYELGLVNEKTSSVDLESTIVVIQRATKTKVGLEKGIVQISVDYADAETAAKIANAIAKTYIKVDADKKGELARNIRISIEEQLTKAKQRLSEAENNLKTFKEQEGESVSGIALAMENNISTLEKQKMELMKDYTYEHPDVVKINEQIEDLTKELKSLSGKEMEFARLTREYEVSEKSYRQLQSKLEDAHIAEEKEIQDIKIVKLVTVPEIPIKPNKKLAVIIAIIAGIIVGEFIAITAEAFKF
ncbi:GumC family protein [Candidatus Omnitrophota bacterium]